MAAERGDTAASAALSEPLLGAEEGDPLARVTEPLVLIHSGDRDGGASLLATIANIVNIYLGIALLSMHYAVHMGGWVALVALVCTGALFCLSAHLILRAFDLLPPGVPRTYPELGKAACGAGGLRMVLGLCFLEMAGTVCMLLLIMWQLIQLFLPSEGLLGLSPLHAAVAVSVVALVPAASLPMHRLGWLSAVGSSASFAVTAVVISLLWADPKREGTDQPPAGYCFACMGMLQSIGIFALSVSGHSTLPALRAAMAQPRRFPLALTASFATVLTIYLSVGAVGYWLLSGMAVGNRYFGEASSPLITTDLSIHSVYAGSVDRVLNALVATNAFGKLPSMLLCLQDMLLSVTKPTGAERSIAAYALRLSLLAGCVGGSLAAYRIVGQTMSLLGGIASISCSLLMPVLFYAQLTWRGQRLPTRAAFVLLLAAGTCLMVFITRQNILDVIKAHKPHNHTVAAAAAAAAAGQQRQQQQPYALLAGMLP